MSTKVKIGTKTKVNVKWKVLAIDYSREAESALASKFAKKYGIPKENVSIEPEFISVNENGESVPLTSGIVEGIQDPKFYPVLYEKWIKEKDIKDVDFDEILKIDDLINNSINFEAYDKHRKYTLKWIKWSNFMSYGPDNFFDFTKLKGLVLLSSEPGNQGGKTTFCLDLFRFLLYGKVTSRENDWTLSRVFNRWILDATEVTVEGCISIDGVDYVIKRVISRPSLGRRTEKSKVSQKVSYYKLVNNEYLELDDDGTENQNESSTRETNKTIKEALGNEQDFDLMICVTAKNLEDLISLKDTERGRLLARWIGLLPLEEKDKIARDTFNKSVTPRLMMTKYNKEELEEKVNELTEDIATFKKDIKKLEKAEKDSNTKIENYYKEKDALLESKAQIDESLTKVDKVTLETTKERLAVDGKKKAEEKAANEEAFKEFGEISFSENDYQQIIEDDKNITVEITTLRSEYKAMKANIETLKKGEYCPTCGAKLANVDNSKAIAEKTAELEAMAKRGAELTQQAKEIADKKAKLTADRQQSIAKNKLELLIAKNDVDLESLRSQYRDVVQTLKSIKANADAIAANNKIDIALNNVKANIKSEEYYRDTTRGNIETHKANIKMNEKVIEDSKKIIATIGEEEKLVRNWRVYLEMVGKNGISKMVLRTALPFINGELKNLLSGVCDFTVEVGIDDHNDVSFTITSDGKTGALGSGSGFEQTVASLALRSVLSKISTFSKPSFVVFDEVLGGVCDENYDNIKLLYDKIAKDYDFVFQITHLKQIVDWHNSHVVVVKENHISKIKTE